MPDREMTAEEKEVHALRVKVDEAIKAVGARKPVFKVGGREIALAYTKLQEAKMWLGKVLEALGSQLPAQYRDESPQA